MARKRRQISSRALQEAGRRARGLDRLADRVLDGSPDDAIRDAAREVAQRVFNAITEAVRSGESGDVSPLLYGPVIVAAEQCALVAIRAAGLPANDETAEEVAAYFFASMVAATHKFDIEHFEQWRKAVREAPEP